MKKIILSIAVIAASISLYSFAPKAKNSDAVNFTVTAQKSRVDFTGSKKSDYHTGYFTKELERESQLDEQFNSLSPTEYNKEIKSDYEVDNLKEILDNNLLSNTANTKIISYTNID